MQPKSSLNPNGRKQGLEVGVIRIAHIINPVAVEADSRFFFIQQVTLQTMVAARNFSRDNVEVTFITAQYPEDHAMVPAGFTISPDLTHSILDHGNFKLKRKLPLLQEILVRGYTASDADYLIYTNMDIGLMPHFYQTVTQYIQHGYDAFTINRRSISDHYRNLHQIPEMYSEIGEPHRGWDCFVFSRLLFPKIDLGTICVGMPLVGLCMISNLIAHAGKFRQFTEEHLTFHLGDDRAWSRDPRTEYLQHNRDEALRILKYLEAQHGKFPPNSPPRRYLARHRNRLYSYIYDYFLMRLYIPAKFTRIFKHSG